MEEGGFSEALPAVPAQTPLELNDVSYWFFVGSTWNRRLEYT